MVGKIGPGFRGISGWVRKGKLRRSAGETGGQVWTGNRGGVKLRGLLHGSSTGDGAGGRSEMGRGGRWLGGSGRRDDGEG